MVSGDGWRGGGGGGGGMKGWARASGISNHSSFVPCCQVLCHFALLKYPSLQKTVHTTELMWMQMAAANHFTSVSRKGMGFSKKSVENDFDRPPPPPSPPPPPPPLFVCL